MSVTKLTMKLAVLSITELYYNELYHVRSTCVPKEPHRITDKAHKSKSQNVLQPLSYLVSPVVNRFRVVDFFA